MTALRCVACLSWRFSSPGFGRTHILGGPVFGGYVTASYMLLIAASREAHHSEREHLLSTDYFIRSGSTFHLHVLVIMRLEYPFAFGAKGWVWTFVKLDQEVPKRRSLDGQTKDVRISFTVILITSCY